MVHYITIFKISHQVVTIKLYIYCTERKRERIFWLTKFHVLYTLKPAAIMIVWGKLYKKTTSII